MTSVKDLILKEIEAKVEELMKRIKLNCELVEQEIDEIIQKWRNTLDEIKETSIVLDKEVFFARTVEIKEPTEEIDYPMEAIIAVRLSGYSKQIIVNIDSNVYTIPWVEGLKAKLIFYKD